MTFMTKGERDYDPHMNNFAVYGYLSNAQWKVTFQSRFGYARWLGQPWAMNRAQSAG